MNDDLFNIMCYYTMKFSDKRQALDRRMGAQDVRWDKLNHLNQ